MTKVLSVFGNMLELDESPLRTAGGGQPADNGILKTKIGYFDIKEVVKKDGKVYHVVDGASLEAGDEVEVALDEDRRKKLTRMHTGEHILFQSLKRQCPDIELDKINLDEKESSLFVVADDLSWEKIFTAESLANDTIKAGIAVTEQKISKDDAKALSDLRIKADRIKDDSVRVIDIDGFDKSACSGTHCDNTSEVGIVYISRFNSLGKNRYEVRFVVDDKEMFNHARLARETMSFLNSEPGRFVSQISKMKDDLDEMKKRLRELSKDSIRVLSEEKVGDILLLYGTFEFVDKKQLIDRAALAVKENEKSIAALVNLTEKQLILAVSEDSGLDASAILDILMPKIGGKGGGKKNFAMCGFTEGNAIIHDLKEILIKFK